MLVKNWMTTPAIVIDADASIADAMRLLEENEINMLPVIEKNNLIGTITDQDLKRAKAAAASTMETYDLKETLSILKVKALMCTDVVTIPLDYTVDEAAEVLLDNKISGAPVVGDHGDVEGVITKTDIFKVLVSLTGLKKRGILYALRVEDRPGSIKDITSIIRKYNGRVASILTSYDDAPDGYRIAYIRMYDIDRLKLSRLNDELRKKACLLYMVDRRETVREIF